LDMPVQHYQPSQRLFPETLPALEYEPGALVRKVQSRGRVTYHDREFNVGKGLLGEYVELRPTETDGLFDVYYCMYRIRQIDTTIRIP